KVIQFTLDKKIVLDRTPFALFPAMATGISWMLWVVAAARPFSVILVPIGFPVCNKAPIVTFLTLFLSTAYLVSLPIPVSMAHTGTPVSGMVWVLALLAKFSVMTLGGVLYTWPIAFVIVIPLLVVLALAGFVVIPFLFIALLVFVEIAFNLLDQMR